MSLPPGLVGLSTAEASARLRQFGPNRPVPRKAGTEILELLRILADPMVLMLLMAAGFYLALGQRGDALVLTLAAIPVLAVDVLLEAQARNALKRLAAAVAPSAWVVRDESECEVPTEELVPGDLLVMREGDVLFADGVVRWAANLATDESQLSGEADAQPKAAFSGTRDHTVEEQNLFYAGSSVVAGHGYGEVIVTGKATRYGKIAGLVAEALSEPTPLERKTARIARGLMAGAIVVSATIFALMLVRRHTLGDAFLYAITVAVSAIPEEYPLVLTLFLSLGAWRLSRHSVMVRRIASVETLGSTTVICLDKTGTLTRGRFDLEQHKPLGDTASEAELLEAAALACELNASDPMDRAILEHCAAHHVDVPALHAQWRLVHDYPFEITGKHMSHIWVAANAGGERNSEDARIVAKGALEGILEHCALSSEEREQVESLNVALAENGMRVLAVAGRWGVDGRALGEPSNGATDSAKIGDCRPQRFTGVREQDERDLRLYGLLAFRDPLRPEVKAAIAECQGAGVKIKLITGDHALTAHAIAEASGMIHEDDMILSGAELDEISPHRLPAIARRVAIFARVRPEQKYAIVDALARAGEVVAMTGDGINDAPALRRASIGIAMGRRGTEVARASASMVLLEDDLGALVAAVGEGRRIFANIQRAFCFLVGFKTMVISLALAAPALGLPILLRLVQLVWLELVVHPVSALIFENEPGPADLMQRLPRSPSAPLIPLGSSIRAALSGLLLAAGALALYFFRLPLGAAYGRSAAMAVAIGGSLVMAWSELAGSDRWWRAELPRRPRFWIVMTAVAVSLPLSMAWRPLAGLLQMSPIAARDWALAGLIVVTATFWRALGWGVGGALHSGFRE